MYPNFSNQGVTDSGDDGDRAMFPGAFDDDSGPPKTTNTPSLNVDGNSITDPVGIANSMNQFFCNVNDELCKVFPIQ